MRGIFVTMGFPRSEYNPPSAFAKDPYAVLDQRNNNSTILVAVTILNLAELDTTHLFVV